MKSLLLVIDIQKDFINEHTESLLQKLNDLLNNHNYDHVLFTRYINSTENILYKKLNYKGCMTEQGQKIVIDTKDYKIIDKDIYSSLNEELKQFIVKNNISKIYICGISTDCCVLKTAFDLFENDYDVYVLKDYCACTHGQKIHDNSLELLKSNIGYDKLI